MDLIIKLLAIFFFSSVIGWIIELGYKRLIEKRKVMGWKNPGFLNGPYLPPYGIAACIIYLISGLAIGYWEKIIIVMLFPTFLEYITAVFLRYAYGIRTWDYSKEKFNYKGIICVKVTLCWMILSLLYYVFINPVVVKILPFIIHDKRVLILIGIFIVMFVMDELILLWQLPAIRKVGNRIDKFANIRIVK